MLFEENIPTSYFQLLILAADFYMDVYCGENKDNMERIFEVCEILTENIKKDNGSFVVKYCADLSSSFSLTFFNISF